MASKKVYYVRFASGNIIRTFHPEYHKDGELLATKEGFGLYREQIKANLLEHVKPGDTIYTLITHVARSGMSRNVRLFHIRNNQLCDITYIASILTGRTQADDGGLKVGGCGFDAGFDCVYAFGKALWPNGTEMLHGTRNGKPDSDGGYALKQSSI